MIELLRLICNKILITKQWPSQWTRSILLALPKKGNLKLCANYRTISLISTASKVMLKVILKRLTPQAEAIISEEQAGFRKNRSTAEQIFNLRILCEKHIEQQKEIHHCFIDFKKVFERVWQTALWKIMEKKNIDKYLIDVIKALYNDSTSAVLIDNTFSECFDTTVGVRQGCLLSPTLVNIFLEEIMDNTLEGFEPTISIGRRKLCNLRFTDDIDQTITYHYNFYIKP